MVSLVERRQQLDLNTTFARGSVMKTNPNAAIPAVRWSRLILFVALLLAAVWFGYPQEKSPSTQDKKTTCGNVPDKTKTPQEAERKEPTALDRLVMKGLKLKDERGAIVYEGDIDLAPTLERIKKDEKFPHRNDGATFGNRERRLPQKPPGYYKEYVVPTPEVRGPGPQRLVIGEKGEVYYTSNHYASFKRVQVPIELLPDSQK